MNTKDTSKIVLALNRGTDVYPSLVEDLRKQLEAVKEIQVEEKVAALEPVKLGFPHEVLEFVVQHKDIAIDLAVPIILEIWKAAWQRWGSKDSPRVASKKIAPEAAPREQEHYAILKAGGRELWLPNSSKAIRDFIEAVEGLEHDEK